MTGIITASAMSSHSRYGQRIRRRFESQLHLLAAGLPDQASMAQTFTALKTAGFDTSSALRTTRQLCWNACCAWTATPKPPCDK